MEAEADDVSYDERTTRVHILAMTGIVATRLVQQFYGRIQWIATTTEDFTMHL